MILNCVKEKVKKYNAFSVKNMDRYFERKEDGMGLDEKKLDEKRNKIEAENIVKQMSLEDKIAVCSGKDFWHTKEFGKYHIPAMLLCDGPHGLRKQKDAADMLGMNESVPATSFPTAALSACSFDEELLMKEGKMIAEEALAEEVDVVLGPGACLKKNPLCGRNFEYFSEDPYLAGKLSAAFIRGAQSTGVGTSLKHFACNNQETKRFNSNSIVDERTLREMYLTAFEIAVKEAQPRTVMCSYNKLNGTYSSDNARLLSDILRGEWGFKGMVVTDWGAMHDRAEGFRAGCDLMMPGGSGYGERRVLKMAKKGELPEKAIDSCAQRVVELALQSRKIRDSAKKSGKNSFDREEHHHIAREVAEKSIVLLKNDNKILPVKEGDKIALIGFMAEKPRYQGAGSSHINPTRLSSLKEFMSHAVYAQGCDEAGDTTPELLRQAQDAARTADKAVIVAGLTDAYESEGFDRESMGMPDGHLQMIRAVSEVNTNIVVVLCCGSVVETPWEPEVKGILYAGLSGQAGGEAIANVLTGKVNPSGRLAETWPVRYEDCPSSSYYGKGFKDAQYREGIYVGYRYYDRAGQAVRWPFGYGLSYTAFLYKNMEMTADTVSVTVENIGERAGEEAVLCYILPPQDGIYRPVKELKRFTKIFLHPGEQRTVSFKLDERCFAVWKDGWVVPGGRYGIQIGTQQTVIPIEGRKIEAPSWQKDSWYGAPSGNPRLEDWECLTGHAYQEKLPEKGAYTVENTIIEMKDHSLIMKIMYKAVEGVISKGFGGKKDYDDPAFKMMMASAADCSLSSSQINGGMRDGLMQGIVEMANGHFLRGIQRMIKGE